MAAAGRRQRVKPGDLGQITRAPPPREWRLRHELPSVARMAATGFGIYICFRLMAPFLPAITAALALAVVFAPLQRYSESKLKRSGLATLLSVLVIALLVIAMASLITQQLVTEVARGAQLIEMRLTSGEWLSKLHAYPRLAQLPQAIERQMDLSGAAQTLAKWLNTTAGSILKGSVFQLIGILLTFYLLFFFLRDRHAALRMLRVLSPFSDEEMDHVFERVGDTIAATIHGMLAVSAAQGLLGGLMFWWLGFSAPLLWGVVMAVLAVIPVVGAFVVWIPAALYLALDGSWGKALILALWGMFVVSTIDNLLRPLLVGKRLNLHTVLAFLSMAGGLILFGPAGIILGPVVLAVTTVLLEIQRERGLRMP
jgi:predicted PurR-regulated permease PerM